jgi:hypothetical protein
MKLIDLLSEYLLETYFIQVIIKIDKNKANNTEIYNQIRAINSVVVIKTVFDAQVESMGNSDYDYTLLEIKFINISTPVETINNIKSVAKRIFGLVGFNIRPKTLVKIRNY